MTEDQAIALLRFHAEYPLSTSAKSPESHFLCEKFFIDVMKSIKTLSHRFSSDIIEKEIVAYLMAICHKVMSWETLYAQECESELHRFWSDMICKAITNLLRGHRIGNELEEYQKYMDVSDTMSY